MQTAVKPRSILLHLFLALANAYGLSVAGFLLLRSIAGESWNYIALINSFVHLLWIPALLLLPLAAALRRWLTLILLCPAALAFLISYGSLFIPRPAQAAPEALRILTYNLKAQSLELEPALHIIAEAQADVVALQELSVEMAAALTDRFSSRYPYQALHTDPDNPISGQGVLSRFPILEDDYWRIYQAMQRVVLELDGRPIVLYNAHPIQPIRPNGFVMRAEEISDLLRRAAQETLPVILAGDFNMSDQSSDYSRLAAQYQDTYRAVGWGLGLTFPAEVPYFGGGQYAHPIFQFVPPLVRLDYVFHDASFTSLSAQVWPEAGGSDHLPVVAALAWSQAASESGIAGGATR
jgi:endonuclease/exonuclease/phosphatase (EEP) superfamily protein YafD